VEHGLELEDEFLFDHDETKLANQLVSEFLDKMQHGRTDFPEACDLAVALEVLVAQARQSDETSRRLLDSLWSPNGVKYAALVPEIAALQSRSNTGIEKARARRREQLGWVQLPEEERCPF
jgi:hypothetical protein